MLHRLRSFAVQCPKGRVTAEGSHRKAEYLLDGSEHADAGAGQEPVQPPAAISVNRLCVTRRSAQKIQVCIFSGDMTNIRHTETRRVHHGAQSDLA